MQSSDLDPAIGLIVAVAGGVATWLIAFVAVGLWFGVL